MATKTHSNLAYLCRAIKAPSLAAEVQRLGERARAENWTHEEFPAGCLERKVSARADHGGRTASELPASGPQEHRHLDFDHQRSIKRDVIAHLGALRLRRGPGQRGLPRPSGNRQDRSGHWTRHERVPGRTPGGLRHRSGVGGSPRRRPRRGAPTGRAHPKLGRVPLLVIDEVGYIPFEAEPANLFFQLVSSRYEGASVIVTSNKAFGSLGDVFGDDAVAGAMIDRHVHHATVVNLKAGHSASGASECEE